MVPLRESDVPIRLRPSQIQFALGIKMIKYRLLKFSIASRLYASVRIEFKKLEKSLLLQANGEFNVMACENTLSA